MKVQDGTPALTSKSLCETCKHSIIVKGASNAEHITFCNFMISGQEVGRITFKVVECSEYVHRNTISLYDMKKIAWLLRIDGPKGKMGFIQPKDLDSLEHMPHPHKVKGVD